MRQVLQLNVHSVAERIRHQVKDRVHDQVFDHVWRGIQRGISEEIWFQLPETIRTTLFYARDSQIFKVLEGSKDQ